MDSVIDNGRTLVPEQWNSDKITIHPNKNVGGAGGFTRGMIESMEQPEDITHVLLMDDDVIILPESIRRMYYLLSMLSQNLMNTLSVGQCFAMKR